MKKRRFSVEQITAVLQQVGGGVPVGDVCRQVGTCRPGPNVTFARVFRWRASRSAC